MISRIFRKKLSIAAFVGPLLLAGPGASAQSSGRISGRVLDQTGAVLPGVTIDVFVKNIEQGTTTTGQDGTYQFENVPAGPVEVVCRLLNFSVIRRTVDVTAGQSVTVNIFMTLSLNADVVVTGTRTFRNIAEVENPAENLVGIAASASQGAITAAQLDARPIMRSGEVLETVPGMVISQHSGEGKANQYYLRGFNLDHGTDFSTTVAGVPVNTPTGAHAHGYADISFLIPELVSGVQFKKGPYFADEGDFSAAGAANINYVNTVERPTARLSAGNDGWMRFFGVASPRVGDGSLLAAFEANHNDGPWVRPDNYKKYNGVLRYSQGDNRNGFSITGMGYWADWDSTDQVAQRAIDSGLIPRFGNLDPSDGGEANRQSVAVELQRSSGPSSIRATGYALRNSLNLFSNFTYFLDDPERGDQFEQAERRVTVGGRVTYRRLGHLFDRHVESAIGVQVRRDWLDPVGLYRNEARTRLSTTREDEVGQTMAGFYGQSEIEWTRFMRTTFGLRADLYQFSVTSDNPLNSGDGTDALVSPKVGVVFGPWSGSEFYVNAGGGFHSNDARGAVIRVDPVTGETADPVTPLVRATGAEVGLRTVRIRGLQSTVALWYLDLDSELLFVGDAGTTEAGRPSRRIGLEWTNYARIKPWLTVDADVAFTRARFRDDDPVGDNIPGSLDRVISAGVTVEPRQPPLFGSVRVRHFGPRSLAEDGSVRSESTTLWNGEVGYRISTRARLVLELFNIFDAKVSDIDYFYASRLAGEPDGGIEDIHTHPALPRSLRLGVQFSF
jgi:hypothetical protein